MLHFFAVDKTAKITSLITAAIHTVTLVILIILLLCLGLFLCQGNGTTGLEYIHRIILISTGAIGIFLPFNAILIYGILKDKLGLIRLWIVSIILQQTYIFCVCFGANIYMAIRLNLRLGLITIGCLTVFVGITMQCLLYINYYYQSEKISKSSTENENSTTENTMDKHDQVYIC